MSETQTSNTAGGFYAIMLGVVAYTAIGTGAGLLWSLAASTVPSLPAIGLLAFLALWWIWFLFLIPNVVMLVSIFQALKVPLEKK